MLKMVETFSGIGAQAKALSNIKASNGYAYEILNTADWDINAIIAYDLIHNGKQNLDQYDSMTKEELLNIIKKYSLSIDGKKQATEDIIKKTNIEVLKRLCCAIDRTKNLISVTDIKGEDLPIDTNILTYSFPCQDLSVAGFWHGNKGGIDRQANNRSSMLWQIERILQERKQSGKPMPKFLLMENVRNITSGEHIANFKEWQGSLEELGYYNKVLKLNAQNFGIPQKRERIYMISFLVSDENGDKNLTLESKIEKYLIENDLQNYKHEMKELKNFLRLNYKKEKYKLEANFSQPNDTKSRRDIAVKNQTIYDGVKVVTKIIPTLTTKQDRHPNSGIISYPRRYGKSNFRYLSPRECFLLMGFEEEDYDAIIDNDFIGRANDNFFNGNKLIKMAGNSIVVQVLEEIFKLINKVNEEIYIKKFGILD